MGGIEQWGTSLILWLQAQGSPLSDSFFTLVSLLGDEKFYLILLPLVYWCFDKRIGLRLAALVMASNMVNLWCKYAFTLPRPPVPPVRPIGTEVGPGFPSGHTQAVTVALGYLARRIKQLRIYVGAGCLVALVGLSRLYLGVHFPHDVFGGLVIGLAMLAAFSVLAPVVEAGVRQWPKLARYGLALAAPALLLCIWPLDDAAGCLGALAGFAVGGLYEAECLGFDARGPWGRRALRFVAGLIGVAVLYFGLKAALPEGILWRFLRYGLVGLYAAAGAPWLFLRLGLAQEEREPELQAA